MRSMILLCATAALLSACATSSISNANLTPKQKTALTLEEIKLTYRNRDTASCKEIDKAMAYTYTLFRALDDKKIVKEQEEKTKGTSLILKGVFSDLNTEYKSRCDGKPLQYIAVRKLYPEIAAEVERRQKEKQK